MFAASSIGSSSSSGRVLFLSSRFGLGIANMLSSLLELLRVSTMKMERWSKFKERKRPHKIITKTLSDYLITFIKRIAFGEFRVSLMTTFYYKAGAAFVCKAIKHGRPQEIHSKTTAFSWSTRL